MQHSSPMHWDHAIKAWIITLHSAAERVLRDWRTFTVDNPSFSTAQAVGRTMVAADGPDHIRLRKPYAAPFRRDAINSHFANFLEEESRKLITSFRANGEIDLRAQFVGPLAARAIIHALSLHDADEQHLRQIVMQIDNAISDLTSRQITKFPQLDATRELAQLMERALDQAESSPPFEPASTEGISRREIVSTHSFFVLAGIDTTETAIASCFYHILRNPGVHAAAKTNTNLIPKIVEETLRIDPPGAMIERYARQPVSLYGNQIQTGDLILVSVLDANRDPAIFASSETFDPYRTDLDSHLSFAAGRHYCLGVHLARLEAEIAIRTFLQELPAARLLDSRSVQPHGLISRGTQDVYVAW